MAPLLLRTVLTHQKYHKLILKDLKVSSKRINRSWSKGMPIDLARTRTENLNQQKIAIVNACLVRLPSL